MLPEAVGQRTSSVIMGKGAGLDLYSQEGSKVMELDSPSKFQNLACYLWLNVTWASEGVLE